MIERIGNIDKYINWYENLCVRSSKLKDIEKQEERYFQAAVYLRDRYLLGKNNLKSEKLSYYYLECIMKLGHELSNLINWDAKDDLGKNLFYLPDNAEWNHIKYLRRFNLERTIKDFDEIVDNSILPPIELAKEIIAERIKLYPVKHLDYYKRCWPLPNYDEIREDFLQDICTFDFVQYLHSFIADITEQKSQPDVKNKLKWQGTPAELGTIIYELVEKGYIKAHLNPKTRPKGEPPKINYNELARQTLESFDADTTLISLSQSLNPECKNGQISDENRALKIFELPISINEENRRDSYIDSTRKSISQSLNPE